MGKMRVSVPWAGGLVASILIVLPWSAAAATCDKCRRHITVSGPQAVCLDKRLSQALKLTGDLVYVSLAKCQGISSGTRLDPPLAVMPKWRKDEAEGSAGYWFVRGDAECLKLQLARRPAKAKLYEFDLSTC